MGKETSKKEFNIHLDYLGDGEDKKDNVIIIREGEAEKVIYPEVINISAALSAPGIFVSHLRKHGQLKPDNHIVTIDKAARLIIFHEDMKSVYGSVVTGTLEIDSRLKNIGINTSKRYTREELYSFVRLNKHAFPNKEAHLLLCNAVKNFSANLTKDFQSGNDNRGSKTAVNNQTLTDTNIPFDFMLNTVVFKGFPAVSFNVEVMLDVSDGGVRFWLESPELASFTEELADCMIEEEITGQFDGLTIIYK